MEFISSFSNPCFIDFFLAHLEADFDQSRSDPFITGCVYTGTD
jgi:hypothetical protein